MSPEQIFREHPDEFRLRWEAQEIIRRACDRAHDECMRYQDETSQWAFTHHIDRFNAANQIFQAYDAAFQKLHRALMYLAAQNGVVIDGKG